MSIRDEFDEFGYLKKRFDHIIIKEFDFKPSSGKVYRFRFTKYKNSPASWSFIFPKIEFKDSNYSGVTLPRADLSKCKTLLECFKEACEESLSPIYKRDRILMYLKIYFKMTDSEIEELEINELELSEEGKYANY